MAEKTPEEIALEKIRECHQTKAVRLSLTNGQLSRIPPEIGELNHLSVLELHSNQLDTIPSEIYQLSNLQTLSLSNNKLKNLPHGLSKLTNLVELRIGHNFFSILPVEITKLSNLKELEITANTIKKIPAEIGDLSALQSFLAGNNILNYLPPEIGNLKSLKVMSIAENRLETFPREIGNLVNLELLYAENAGLRFLPKEIMQLVNLKTLYLSGNTLSIPLEILTKTNDPVSILNYYFSIFRETESLPYKTAKSLNEIKMLVVGQGSVGKTSLVKRLSQDEFDVTEIKTDGIEISQWEVDFEKPESIEQYIQVNIWDFGGQEIMHATHQFFLTKRSMYLLVLDSRLTQEENRVEYWLKIIQSFGGESPVLIVGNKTDQHPLDIDRTGLQKKYPNIVGILETSAATGAGIEVLATAIAEQVNHLPHVRDLLPETWFAVKIKLEELRHQSNFITHDKYLDLCAENEVSDETSQRTLIGFLHDLGVVLHFQDDPRLEALGILNPQWVTNGVYKILNSHELFQNKGVLALAMLNSILNIDGYPRDKRLFIVDMMKKFELCYDIEPDKTFLVPDLLPKDEPAELKFNGVPAFEYAYPVLPSSVITRFIVRMNQKIDDGLVWRTGVVLKIGDNKALVKADIEDRKVTIAIQGLEHTRRDALSAIRFQLDEIHASIKGLDAQKRVPIPEAPNAEPLEYDYLLMLEREGQEVYLAKDKSRLVKVNIRQLLSAIESESQRRENTPGSVTTNYYIQGDVNASGDFIGRDKNTSPRNQTDE